MHATWSSLSLRWRLTIFYIGLLTALLVVLGLLLDAQLNGFLVDNTAERLIAQARPILARSPDKPKGSEPA
ncbi:MAG: hypothetical protein HYR71_03555, partial [Chloroflexi bacterium]|nr:hypothetical protein [Chloroflexota bacterium]